MKELDHQIKYALNRHDYVLKGTDIISEDYKNKLIRVECEDCSLIIKLFSDNSTKNIPRIGDAQDTFVGGWYVHSRVSKCIESIVPDVIGSEFSESMNFYIMEDVQYSRGHNWTDNMYLMRMCQDIGNRLSDIHQISNNKIGGIPGKESDPMRNMRRYIKKVEHNVKQTKYEEYQDNLNKLAEKYEELYQPNNKWLIHGQIEPTNILTDNSGIIKSIVDWDNAMYADPLLDIAMCQANICDTYDYLSSWSSETIRDAVTESYQHSVNPDRLDILRAIVCLNIAAKSDHPHRKVRYSNESKNIEKTHLKSFKKILDTIE